MTKVVIKIRGNKTKGAAKAGGSFQGVYEYTNEINLDDFKVMAILFEDLERYGASIEKIYQEFKKRGLQEFPF